MWGMLSCFICLHENFTSWESITIFQVLHWVLRILLCCNSLHESKRELTYSTMKAVYRSWPECGAPVWSQKGNDCCIKFDMAEVLEMEEEGTRAATLVCGEVHPQMLVFLSGLWILRHRGQRHKYNLESLNTCTDQLSDLERAWAMSRTTYIFLCVLCPYVKLVLPFKSTSCVGYNM